MISPSAFKKLQKIARNATQEYVIAREKHLNLKSQGFRSVIQREDSISEVIGLRFWHYEYQRRVNDAESKIIPFGGRISPSAEARHNRRHGK